MSKVTDLRGQLDAVRQKMSDVFAEAGEDMDMEKVTSIDGDSKAKADQIKRWNDEMTDLGAQIDDLESYAGMKDRTDKLSEVQKHPGHGKAGENGNTKAEQKQELSTIGDLFVESEAFKTKGVISTLNVEVKALLEESGGWAPWDVRLPRFVDYRLRPLGVTDLIPSTTTSSNAITYVQEDSWSNAATEIGEGTAKPEATLNTSTVTEPVRKIAVWIPVTDEQLADVPQVRGYLNNRLGFMVRQRLDQQILTGNGTAPNISGIQDRTDIQTQAKGADPTPDAVYKAMTKIRIGTNSFSEPNAAVFHPNDWEQIRLLRTADGLYIWGAPMDAGPQRIWGLNVAVTTAESEGTALVGDFNQAELAMRSGLEIRTTDSHASYFIANITVVLAELRAALLVYRPASFCTVTGI